MSSSRDLNTILIMVLLIEVVCGSPAHAIRGARNLPAGSFLSVGTLDPACVATLIQPNVIITVNHCIEQAGGLENLTFNYSTVNGGVETLKAKRVEVNSSDLNEELALVLLEKAAKGGRYSKLFTDVTPQKSPSATIVGYGATEKLIRTSDMKGGHVKFDGFVNVHGSPMIKVESADVYSNLPCQGDSGGPLFFERRIYGILSYSDSNDPAFAAAMDAGDTVRLCQLTKNAYYIPIAPHMKWINKTLNNFDAQ